MNESRAAIRYAKAALELTEERNASEAVEKDMRMVMKALFEDEELGEFLKSPVVKDSDKKETLQAIMKGANEISLNLIALLTDNGRIDLLNEVALKYIALYEQLKGEDVAYITTAVPITPQIEEKALKQLASISDKKVSLQNKVDKNIIGGFVLRLGDIQYDASIATKLNNLKREFTNSI